MNQSIIEPNSIDDLNQDLIASIRNRQILAKAGSSRWPIEAEREFLQYIKRAVQQIDITPAQRIRAKRVHDHLAEFLTTREAGLARYELELFVQGSFLQDLVVQPYGTHVIDVDLVCRLAERDTGLNAKTFFDLLIADLRRFRCEKMTPKSRCVQLDVGHSLKMDVIPAFTEVAPEALLIPDRKLECLLPTSPRLFATWLDEKAKLVPVVVMSASGYRELSACNSSVVQDFPKTDGAGKKPLKWIIQLAKAHRNRFFKQASPPVSSIVITTLCTLAYEESLRSLNTDSFLAHLVYVLTELPSFVVVDSGENGSGKAKYFLPNPVEPRENFTEGWEEKTFHEFLRWNENLAGLFRGLVTKLEKSEGLAGAASALQEVVGEDAVSTALRRTSQEVAQGVKEQRISVIGPVCAIAPAVSLATTIPRHTFDGEP